MYIARGTGRLTMGHQRGAFAAAVGLAAMLSITGCGSHSPGAQASPTTRTASVAKKAMAKARLIAQALVDDTSAKVLPLLNDVAGPVMPSYLRMEALWDDIDTAAGVPGQPGAVKNVADGFQICYAGQGGCQSLTGFHWDSAGLITGFTVDGQLISPRLAVGGTYSGSALTFSSVYSYLQTSDGVVNVLFEIRNTSGHSLGSAKRAPFLPILVTAAGTRVPYDKHDSVLFAGPLAPGAVMEGIAAFDTTALTGRFTLRSNTANRHLLATATLRKPPAL